MDLRNPRRWSGRQVPTQERDPAKYRALEDERG
jgi:hypothetical protein